MSASASPAAAHGFAGAGIANSRVGAFGFGRSTIATRSVTGAAFVRGPVFGLGRFAPIGGFGPRFGFPFVGVRCCGFGFGFGFGGFGWNPFWNPFWFDAAWNWGWGWPGYGYGYYAPYPLYPPPGAYPPSVDYHRGDDNSYPPAAESSVPSAPANPDWDTSANAPAANQAATAQSSASVVIYLKNGTSYSPSDYWIAENKLHYIVNGAENVVDVDQVDLQHTIDANDKNGVKFWLKSAPDGSPDTSAAPDEAVPQATPQSAPGGGQDQNNAATSPI